MRNAFAWPEGTNFHVLALQLTSGELSQIRHSLGLNVALMQNKGIDGMVTLVPF